MDKDRQMFIGLLLCQALTPGQEDDGVCVHDLIRNAPETVMQLAKLWITRRSLISNSCQICIFKKVGGWKMEWPMEKLGVVD